MSDEIDALAARQTDWRQKLLEKGGTLANVITALKGAPEWEGVIAHDEFALQIIAIKSARSKKDEEMNSVGNRGSRSKRAVFGLIPLVRKAFVGGSLPEGLTCVAVQAEDDKLVNFSGCHRRSGKTSPAATRALPVI